MPQQERKFRFRSGTAVMGSVLMEEVEQKGILPEAK